MNILTIILDQVTLSDLRFAGGKVCQTPNIDALAAESADFTQAYTPCPVCAPARGTFMSGLYPHGHGIIRNPGEAGLPVLPDMAGDEVCIGTLLKDAGYNLGFVGKYHVGRKLPGDYGFEGMNVPGHGSGGFARGPMEFALCAEYADYLDKNGLTRGVLRKPVLAEGTVLGATLDAPEEAAVPYFLAETANGFLSKFGGQWRDEKNPFYVTLNFWGPHPPCYVPEPCASMYDDADIEEWPTFREDLSDKPSIHRETSERVAEFDWAHFKKMIAYHFGFMTFIDKQIGRVLDRLEAEGLAEETVVILTADHGGFWGQHGGQMNKGFRMYEENTRIPMLIRVPGAGAGRKVSGFASGVDLYPTVLDFAGVDVPASRHGFSLKAAASDPSIGDTGQDVAVTEFHGLCGALMTQRGLRFGKYKYVHNIADCDEFYDLELDPHEARNLIDSVDKDLLKEARLKLIGWMERTGDRAQIEFCNRHRLHATPPPIKCYGFEVLD